MADPRTLRSKHRIRSAFLALAEARGIEDMTIRDITDHAGVGYTTFFRHFETKQDLIATIIDQELADLIEISFPMLVGGLPYEASLASARHILSRRKLWAEMTSASAAPILRERFMRHMLALSTGRIMGSGFLPRSVTASLAATLLVELLQWWLRTAEPSSPAYLAEAIDRIVVKPALQCW